MLRHFRINDPYRLVSLLVMVILASIPFLIDLPDMTSQELKGMVIGEVVGNKIMYAEVIDQTPPLMALFDGLLNFVFWRSLMARHILALFIIFFQAAYFGILLINNKVYNESNYLPSLIFGFLCFFSFDLLAVTPELLANGLLLLSLDNLFREIEFRSDKDSNVLNLGVFLGLASLFVFSYTIFLVGSIAVLLIFARSSLRKLLLMLFGYVLVHAVLFTVYYCYERADELWINFYVTNFTLSSVSLVSFNSIFILAIVPMVYFVFSLFMLTREAHFTRYQSQLFQVMFLWIGIALIEIWITPEFTPHSFLTFIPPLSYLISHYLLLINRKWIAELMLWIFIAGLFSVSLLSRNKRIEGIDYSLLFPQPFKYSVEITDKKVMILGDDLAVYRKNRLGGYFLNWDLSKKYFDNTGYYENLSKINQAIVNNPPDVIIDELGLMAPLADKIPELQRTFRRENSVYFRR